MFCVFLNVRYSNPKLMHVGHQYVAANFDPKTLKGLVAVDAYHICLLYTSPSPRDRTRSRMPSSA